VMFHVFIFYNANITYRHIAAVGLKNYSLLKWVCDHLAFAKAYNHLFTHIIIDSVAF
jgi:hypothetical protein